MRLEAEGRGVCCSCDLFEYNCVSQFICVWSCRWVHNRVSSSVSAHICVSCTLLCTSLYWLPIDPVPINKSLFDLCLTTCVLPNSEQINRAYGPFLEITPKSLWNVPSPRIKFSCPRTCGIRQHNFHALSHLALYNLVFSQRHTILVKKPRTVFALAN